MKNILSDILVNYDLTKDFQWNVELIVCAESTWWFLNGVRKLMITMLNEIRGTCGHRGWQERNPFAFRLELQGFSTQFCFKSIRKTKIIIPAKNHSQSILIFPPIMLWTSIEGHYPDLLIGTDITQLVNWFIINLFIKYNMLKWIFVLNKGQKNYTYLLFYKHHINTWQVQINDVT